MDINSLKSHYDVVIIGGGMVGSSFALALANAIKNDGNDRDFSILVVEAFKAPTASSNLANEAEPTGKKLASTSDISDKNRSPSFDARCTALSQSSVNFFENLDIFSRIENQVCPIQSIQVSDRKRLGTATISSEEQKLPALGYVVENSALGKALQRQLNTDNNIDFLAPATTRELRPTQAGMDVTIDSEGSIKTLSSSLTVLADGGKSSLTSQLGISTAEHDYGQTAIISTVGFEKSHNSVAFERFTETGPLAVLPLLKHEGVNRGSLVWTVASDETADILSETETSLKDSLQQRFGHRLGKVTKLGQTFSFPLRLTVAREQIRPGLVLLGNSAHNIHPVAGQGFNLALRDCAGLATAISEAWQQNISPGDMKTLQGYMNAQEADQSRTISLTHHLTEGFSSKNPAMVSLRKLGLLGIDMIPTARQHFARQAMGIGD